MASPPFGAGPAWDKNGNINPTWMSWFTKLGSGDGTAAAGSDGDIQVNEGGVLGADDNLTWDGSLLYVGGDIRALRSLICSVLTMGQPASVPALSPAGSIRMYVNSSGQLLISENGGAYHSIDGGGSGGGLIGIEPMAEVAGHLTPALSDFQFTHEATLTGSVFLDAPTGIIAEHSFCIKLNQDATGGREVIFDSFYTGMSGFGLDTTADTYASLFFQINAAGTSAFLLQIAMNGNPIL